MLVVLLALGGAMAYGVADFVGGLLSRRTSAWAVAFTAALGAGLLVLVLEPVLPGSPTTSDLLWGAVGGIGGGVGTAFLYRGLSAGRMGVVAPISGVGAAVVPVLVALAAGERPGTLVWVGIACALPGIWLVARDPRSNSVGTEGGSAGVLDGVVAGLGFGGQFAALGQVADGSGFLPLGLNQLGAAVVIAALALAVRAPWVPRDHAAYAGLVCGVLGLAATGAFMLAAQQGSLTVSSILTSLYPAFTILLAAIVLRERVLPAQGVGLALCGVAVALVAAG
ncbi:DMT family transporter [Nocardioides sp.]|uniref:DMT family transporter n=1 Tax=Nocardioides sp. TaxID=35761 RepID=UPI002BF7D8CB|nr:DMT family transporter [Nocardioides sp.]HSX68718.1 DMT family transporter [Nocardioides sp.]